MSGNGPAPVAGGASNIGEGSGTEAKSLSRTSSALGATAGYQTLTAIVREGAPGCTAFAGVGRRSSTKVNDVIPTGNPPPSAVVPCAVDFDEAVDEHDGRTAARRPKQVTTISARSELR